MAINRRSFLKRGATATTLAAMATVPSFPRPLHALSGRRGSIHPHGISQIDDRYVKQLAERALDSARTAGASYADVRLTHSWHRGVSPNMGIGDTELLDVGVRALVNGYWGFASGPIWSADEMARLGKEAYHQAHSNALTKPRSIDLAPVPAVNNGQWIMPVTIDPFEINPVEIMDHLKSLEIFAQRKPNVSVQSNSCEFLKQETTFASTTESYLVQRRYRSGGVLMLKSGPDHDSATGSLDCLSPAGLGWELYKEQPLRERIEQLIAELEWERSLPVVPVDVGRYDMVFDAEGISRLLLETLVGATELDRAMGYEANATGTSYLNDPLAMIGTQQVGAAALTISGSRSDAGGCATTKWDDEGVAPDTFTFVEKGVLTDFQTTRESAGWLKPHYQGRGIPIRSHGCAVALRGVYAPLSRAPNVTLRPGESGNTFETLVSGVSKGIAFKRASADVDFQNLNGMAGGKSYEVRNGKMVSRLSGAGVLFRSPELWKSISQLGGSDSVQRFGISTTKGQPEQEHYTSVSAVPVLFRQLTLIDQLRKA